MKNKESQHPLAEINSGVPFWFKFSLRLVWGYCLIFLIPAFWHFLILVLEGLPHLLYDLALFPYWDTVISERMGNIGLLLFLIFVGIGGTYIYALFPFFLYGLFRYIINASHWN